MTSANSYSLRLQSSVMKELRKIVSEEGTTINQFINVAVAEKLAALRTEDYFRERASRASMDTFWSILEQAGTEPPRKGDELPARAKSKTHRRAAVKTASTPERVRP